ncbi:hypothetical protein ACOME3_008976 [Neoechinorhynchus agilis]
MREFSSFASLPFGWANVAYGLFTRYPNSLSKHVLTEDTIEREFTSDGYLRVRKICSKTNKIPDWGAKILRLAGASPSSGLVIEEMLFNVRNRSLAVYNYNLSHRHIMIVEEFIAFKPSGERLTLCDKFVKIKGTFPTAHAALESFGLRRYKKNSEMAFKALWDKLSECRAAREENSHRSLKRRPMVPLIAAENKGPFNE